MDSLYVLFKDYIDIMKNPMDSTKKKILFKEHIPGTNIEYDKSLFHTG